MFLALIFIMKNSNHDLIADKQDIIDGVSFGSKIEIDKINKPSEAENEILNQLSILKLTKTIISKLLGKVNCNFLNNLLITCSI